MQFVGRTELASAVHQAHRLAPHASIAAAQAGRLRPMGTARCDVPRSKYALARAHINQRLSERAACRLMLALLDLADRANVVAELPGLLDMPRERNELPDIDTLREQLAPRPTLMPVVQVINSA